MSGRLRDKVVVITGVGGALGGGVARRFAQEGAILHLLDANGAAELAADLDASGHVVDVSDKGELERAVAKVGARHGRIDILVNAAQSRPPWARLEDMADSAFDDAFRSIFHTARWAMVSALPFLRQAEHARVLNFGSIYGDNVSDLIGDYNAATEALKALTRTAAAEWGRFNIRVNLIMPTLNDDAFRAYAAAHAEEVEQPLSLVALQRFGDPVADIGGAALFLVSDLGAYISGHVVHADGGYHIAGPVLVPILEGVG